MEKGAACKCLCPSMFHISCTKLYVKYGEGMLGYCPIPLYPNSIYMIVLNVLHSPRRKLSMKLQPHLPVQCDCSPPPPFLALPLPLSFLWIASLLILIAYALPSSYLPPSPLMALSILPFH